MGIFDFWLKTPLNYKSCLKKVKIIYLPYYLSHFFLKNPLFDVDLFSRTFEMESLVCGIFFEGFPKSVSQPFPPTALWRRHAQTVRDSTSSYKIDYFIMIKNFLNPEGHQNPFIGSKVTAILLERWIWPIGGVASGRVCACSLRTQSKLRRGPMVSSCTLELFIRIN